MIWSVVCAVCGVFSLLLLNTVKVVYSRIVVCEIRKIEVYLHRLFTRPSPESKSGRGIHQNNRFGSGSQGLSGYQAHSTTVVLVYALAAKYNPGRDARTQNIREPNQRYLIICPKPNQSVRPQRQDMWKWMCTCVFRTHSNMCSTIPPCSERLPIAISRKRQGEHLF